MHEIKLKIKHEKVVTILQFYQTLGLMKDMNGQCVTLLLSYLQS